MDKANKPDKWVAPCRHYKTCGGCQLQNMDYRRQLDLKQKQVEKLLGGFAPVERIIGMDNPFHYRNKVQAAFGAAKDGKIISGVYQANTHRIVDIDSCMIEDETADKIISTVKALMPKYRIAPYDDRAGRGLLRHVLVRRGFHTGEVMVMLVTASALFPMKNRLAAELVRLFPEIKTVVMNINSARTSMVLGKREEVLLGTGYIEDILCGCRFRISSGSFYQINPIQTEKLYNTAIAFAGLTGRESMLDAYCGVGTIALAVSRHAGRVAGVELNGGAVKDAEANARLNGIKNVRFYQCDAGDFITEMAKNKVGCDIVMLDPPRSGSSEAFLSALARMKPSKVVYISCNPETQSRDLKYLLPRGYVVKKIQPVDMFPWTQHVETVVLLEKFNQNNK